MSEWVEDTLGAIANINIGGTPSRDNPKFWASEYEDGFPWVAISDLKSRQISETKERITLSGVSSSNVKAVPAGSLIMSFKLSIGRAGFAAMDLYTNEAIAAITPKSDGVATSYLYYIVPPTASNAVTDTAIKGATFNKRSLAKLRLSFPKDPDHQKKIADILVTVDEAIEQTEALIAKYEQIRAGMMQDLFTRGLTPDGKLRPPREASPDLYQETPIGWIPKGWGSDLLDHRANRRSGHTPSKTHPEYWNGGVRWVSLADSYRLDDLLIEETDFEISELGLQNSSAVMLPKHTVIMSRDAGVGKSAILGSPMAVSQHFMAWVCHEDLDPFFLYYWLQYKKRMFENIAMGSTILTIGLSYFKKLRIGAPIEVREQVEIGLRLRQIDKALSCELSHLQKLRQLKAGLMADLLTGKTPVKV